MSILFEPYKIRNLEIRNRFMRSATTSYWSDYRGVLKPVIIDLYKNLAIGGVGLIVKGHLYVMDEGKAHNGMAGISQDYHVPKLKELTNTIHEEGGKIVAQLNHGGYNSIIDRAGPSDYNGKRWSARGLDIDEIMDIVEAFGDAAGRAMDAGFDAVQIHGAHGYLISQFLSRLANRRTDEYGGSSERRMKLLNEVYDEVRAKVGGCIPVMLKLNCDDFSQGGFTLEDSMLVAESLCKRGLDLLEVSAGGFGQIDELRNRAKSDNPLISEANFAGYTQIIRKVSKPSILALVNGIRKFSTMQALIDMDIIDLVSMSRPFIREPDLVKKLRAGQENATCISCSQCSGREVFSKTMLRCHLD